MSKAKDGAESVVRGVRASSELWARVQAVAERDGISQNSFIVNALRKALAEKNG